MSEKIKTVQQTIDAVKTAIERHLEQLYKPKYSRFLSWTGISTKEGRYYSDVISEELLKEKIAERMKDEIKPLDCKIKRHSKMHINLQSNRVEDNFAKYLVLASKFGKKFLHMGEFIDFQIQLKGKRKDRAGRIDLIALDQERKKAYIVELKQKENKEPLIRAILEISTYYQWLNKAKFIETFQEYAEVQIEESDIRKSVLIFKKSNQANELDNMQKTTHFRQLIKNLNVEIFLITDLFEIEKYHV